MKNSFYINKSWPLLTQGWAGRRGSFTFIASLSFLQCNMKLENYVNVRPRISGLYLRRRSAPELKDKKRYRSLNLSLLQIDSFLIRQPFWTVMSKRFEAPRKGELFYHHKKLRKSRSFSKINFRYIKSFSQRFTVFDRFTFKNILNLFTRPYFRHNKTP